MWRQTKKWRGVVRDCAAGIVVVRLLDLEQNAWNHKTLRRPPVVDVMEQSGMCLASIVVRVVIEHVIEPATLHMVRSHQVQVTHTRDTTSPGVQSMRTLVVQLEKKAEVRGGKATGKGVLSLFLCPLVRFTGTT